MMERSQTHWIPSDIVNSGWLLNILCKPQSLPPTRQQQRIMAFVCTFKLGNGKNLLVDFIQLTGDGRSVKRCLCYSKHLYLLLLNTCCRCNCHIEYTTLRCSCKKCNIECTSICVNSKETGCMNMSHDDDEKETFDSQVNY